jgi:hypothetical protein
MKKIKDFFEKIRVLRKKFLFPVKTHEGVELTTHLQLVPMSGVRGTVHPVPHTSS